MWHIDILARQAMREVVRVCGFLRAFVKCRNHNVVGVVRPKPSPTQAGPLVRYLSFNSDDRPTRVVCGVRGLNLILSAAQHCQASPPPFIHWPIFTVIFSVTRKWMRVSLAQKSKPHKLHPIPFSHTHHHAMAELKSRGTGSKVASRWLTTTTAVGTIVSLVACFTSSGADEQGWQLVVPSTTALPSIEPPSSFNRSANNILPMGTSKKLSEALPNRLQTNKFYSNFLVSAH